MMLTRYLMTLAIAAGLAGTVTAQGGVSPDCGAERAACSVQLGPFDLVPGADGQVMLSVQADGLRRVSVLADQVSIDIDHTQQRILSPRQADAMAQDGALLVLVRADGEVQTWSLAPAQPLLIQAAAQNVAAPPLAHLRHEDLRHDRSARILVPDTDPQAAVASQAQGGDVLVTDPKGAPAGQ